MNHKCPVKILSTDVHICDALQICTDIDSKNKKLSDVCIFTIVVVCFFLGNMVTTWMKPPVSDVNDAQFTLQELKMLENAQRCVCLENLILSSTRRLVSEHHYKKEEITGMPSADMLKCQFLTSQHNPANVQALNTSLTAKNIYKLSTFFFFF